MLFRPSRQAISCRKKAVAIPYSKGNLELFLESTTDGDRHGLPNSSDSRLVVIRFLGCRGRAELSTLDPVDRLPTPTPDFQVWTLNPPGYGKSDGNADFSHYLAAADAIARYFSGVPSDKLVITGKSIGSIGAMFVAARLQPRLTILKNVIPLLQLPKRYGALGRAAPFILHERFFPTALDVMANARNVRSNGLFLISKADSMSPPAYQEEIAETFAGKKSLLYVEGGHDERVLRPQDEAAYRANILEMIR